MLARVDHTLNQVRDRNISNFMLPVQIQKSQEAIKEKTDRNLNIVNFKNELWNKNQIRKKIGLNIVEDSIGAKGEPRKDSPQNKAPIDEESENEDINAMLDE